MTIDPSDEMIKAAEGYLERAGLRDRVRIERGKALDVIPLLKDTFDLIFIDAVKEEYADYLQTFVAETAQRRRGDCRQSSLGRTGCRRDSCHPIRKAPRTPYANLTSISLTIRSCARRFFQWVMDWVTP